MKIGINASSLLGHVSANDLVKHAAQAEQDGFASWWLAQIGIVDALTVLTMAGPATSTIELGTAVIPTYIRHPQTAAAQALTASGFIGDRLVLGIGVSHKPAVEQRWDMKFERPAQHVEEYLRILTSLITTGTAACAGDYWTTNGDFDISPGSHKPSVMLAAMGPMMLRRCAEHTDGTILWMVGPKTIAEHIAPILTSEAAEYQRDHELRIVCGLPVVVTDDPQGARDYCNDVFEIYGHLPSYRAMLDREGAAGPGDVCVIGDEDQVG